MTPDSRFYPDKRQIAARFGQAAPTYHSQAKMQQAGADRMAELLQTYRDRLPPGPVLEIGCGTGFISQKLVDGLGTRPLEITDLSQEMLRFCRAGLVVPAGVHLTFNQLDAEQIENWSEHYAAIVGGFVLQWFQEPHKGILNLVNRLYPEGILLLSFPTVQSFPEWRQICQQLDLPCTANPLPNPTALTNWLTRWPQIQVLELQTVEWQTVYSGAASFFRDLKTIGASTAQQRLSPRQMRRLIQAWDAQTQGKTEVQ